MNNDIVLKEIARGAGIIFIGTFLIYFIKFIYRIAVARYLGPAEYGSLSLGIMLLSVGGLVSMIGLNEAVIRYTAYHRGLKDKKRVKGTFLSALKISMSLSIIASVISTLLSKQIAIHLFHNAELTSILRIFSLTIPLYVLLIMVTVTLMAFKKPEYTFTSRIGRESINLVLALAVIFISGTVLQVSFVYLISMAIGAAIGLFLLEYKVFSFFKSKLSAIYEPKKLLRFSLPLFFSGIFLEIMFFVDTFFLGFFKSTVEVGIYNVALPLAASFGIFLTAFSHISYPIMSELHAKKQYAELTQSYSVILRWLFMLSLPAVLLVLMFPEYLISTLFGAEYIAGSIALTILVSAYFVDVITGPAIRILMTFKKTKFIFYLNLGFAILNVILNIILIPLYSVNGAAMATGISIALREILIVFKARKIVPFSYKLKYYIKYILSAGIALVSVYLILNYLVLPDSLIKLTATLFCFGILYLICLLLFKALGKEDLMIMYAVEEKLGLNLKFLKNIIRKFI